MLSATAAVSLSVNIPAPAQAIPLGNLLFQGIQLIQLSNISDRQEVKIGQQINQQLLRQGMRLYKDPAVNQYVNQVGQRLAAVSDRQVTYKFQIVNDPKINAFATTGGFVYVNTGLLKAADNEAQLASVLAHEMGHIQANHLVEQMQQTAIARGLMTAAGVDQNVLANIGVDLALNRPNSRKDEFEADRRGLETLRKADYAESAMPEFMKKLSTQRSIPTFLSDHPATTDRIAALEKAIRSSSGNSCTQNLQASSCGLDETAYQQNVSSRLASRNR
jgi:predicted Zn-dependent protease